MFGDLEVGSAVACDIGRKRHWLVEGKLQSGLAFDFDIFAFSPDVAAETDSSASCNTSDRSSSDSPADDGCEADTEDGTASGPSGSADGTRFDTRASGATFEVALLVLCYLGVWLTGSDGSR